MNEWNIKSSTCATNTINPIRKTVENMKATPNPNKKPIPLSIGLFLIKIQTTQNYSF